MVWFSWFGIERQNLGTFLENKVHWKSKLSKYVINKSLSPIFVFFNEFFFCKDSADFRHRKMALKIRISLYLTFNTKSSQISRTFLWPFSQTFGLVYSPLNSAKLSCSSEVTLCYNFGLSNRPAREVRKNAPEKA